MIETESKPGAGNACPRLLPILSYSAGAKNMLPVSYLINSTRFSPSMMYEFTSDSRARYSFSNEPGGQATSVVGPQGYHVDAALQDPWPWVAA